VAPAARKAATRSSSRADHGSNRKLALEEQAGYSSPDRSELTGCPGFKDRSVIGHATSLPFAKHPVKLRRRCSVEAEHEAARAGRSLGIAPPRGALSFNWLFDGRSAPLTRATSL